AILSDKQHIYGMPEFEHSDIGVTVDRAIFFADGMAPKPDPAGLQDVMRSLDVSPEECLYVGDSERDIACAQRAGAWSGAALWASVEREIVLARNPEFRWETVNDVGVTLKLGGAK
ncbi:MAG: HAD-IA family hydrolase, partial [Chloroflexi bacterium]|nr:HAD-IA family hydrolase [Chloroflexota bacterium]